MMRRRTPPSGSEGASAVEAARVAGVGGQDEAAFPLHDLLGRLEVVPVLNLAGAVAQEVAQRADVDLEPLLLLGHRVLRPSSALVWGDQRRATGNRLQRCLPPQ